MTDELKKSCPFCDSDDLEFELPEDGCCSGDGGFTPFGRTYYTDAAYALDGIHAFVDVLTRRHGMVSE